MHIQMGRPMRCPACRATGTFAGSKCEVCNGRAILPDTRVGQPGCARCRGTGRFAGFVCDVCGGWGRLPPEEREGAKIWYVTAGSTYQAHGAVADIFRSLSGEARVCDSYYGTGSLARLAELSGCSSVLFLTKTPDAKEKTFLSKRIQEFAESYPNIEFRENSGRDLHDRFVLTDSEFIILGQGLKDIGAKDSFIVRIQRDIALDTIESIRQNFDSRWRAAKPLP